MRLRIAVLSVLAVSALAVNSDAAEPAADPVQLLTAPDGTRYAVLGDKPKSPAPTLLVLGGGSRETLLGEDVNRIGRLMADDGYLSVSVDIPCHGDDVRPGEEAGLTAWRDRIVKGDDLMGPFTANVTKALDHLIAEGYTDPQRIAVSGTSRGGFCAMHAAAADERIRCVLAFAPVTHLPVLREFEGARDNPDVLKLSTIHLVDKLAPKSIWITIGNNDVRVGTRECIDMALALVERAKGKTEPIPIELHLNGTIDHRLHAKAAPQYRQFTSPHDDAAVWLRAMLAAQ
jgi:dienelactone hydrolase